MYTQEQLVKQLRDMGIVSTDVITIHSSLKAIGPVENRACGLIDALRTAVSEGLLLIPAHTYRNIRQTPVFDVRNTMPCIGTLPCIAVEQANIAYDAKDPTCRRSLHPCHSVVAFGNNALEYIQDDLKATSPCPIFGSYGKLIKYHGKILLAGVGMVRNTFLHAVFEAFNTEPPQYPIEILVKDYDGSETTRMTCLACGTGFENYLDILDESGALTYGKLGNADVIVCDAEKCYHTICAMQNN